jgi:hypothetical protein
LIAPDPADDIAGPGEVFSAFANINDHGIGGATSIGIFEGFVGSIVGDRGPMFVRLVKADRPPHR